MSARGAGPKRGRGRGRGGKTQAIKNLERAATDIQNMLKDMKVSGDHNQGGNIGEKRTPDSRGSRSLMDLSIGDGAPYQDPHYRGSPYHDPYYTGGTYGTGHYRQVPPPSGLYSQGPPPPGHCSQGPPPPGHYNPPGHGRYHEGQFNVYPTAPPSYDESVREYSGNHPQAPEQNISEGVRKKPRQGTVKLANVQQLVKALAMFDGQMADTEALSRQVVCTVEEVEKTVRYRKDLFSHMKDGSKTVVELVPNVKLCTHYHSEQGCTARDTCRNLHLCKDYILARCDQGPACVYGHKFDTNHNASILSKLCLDLIKPQQLVSVIRKVCRGNAPPKICGYYSTKGGCKKMDRCRFLHICKDYVMNDGKCSIKGCTLNHQLTVKQCEIVLDQHGMSTNESIRDIILKLKSSMGKIQDNESSTSKEETKKQKEDDSSSDSDSSLASTDESVKKNKQQGKKKEKSGKPSEKGKEKSFTIKSTDFYGDVQIPEICIFGINDKCTNVKKGCKYLHAKSLFHWQVEKENKWYNLRIFQSKALESAYRDVSKGGVKLPAVDPEKLNPHDKQILQLLGTHKWTADFKEMFITDSAKNKLNIRRVSTASSVLSSYPQATVFKWYFEDEQGKWIPYGDIDSLGKQNYVCSITSEDIEKQYLSDPSSSMIISNAHFKYKIDFRSMTQTNLSSSKVREIRRRPAHLSYQKGSASDSSTISLPPHWQPMSDKQTHILVPLDPNQEEFQGVSKSIKLMIPTAKIHEIKRLQNEYLWRLLQYKKADLSLRYDDLTMNVQKLFHGTEPDAIDSICKENIDGRRYFNPKDNYGKGTYFSNSSAIATAHCTPNAQGHIFLIQAEVIIGYVTKGTKSLNRPPPNPSTGHHFDTTVDDITAPTLFVKYEKEEYYPEYIIDITV